jgi:hypothetical protein
MMDKSPSQSDLGQYFASGGVFSRAAEPKGWTLPEGFTPPVVNDQAGAQSHMTLIDISDQKVLRQAMGLSSRKYELWMEALLAAGNWPSGEPTFMGVGYAEQGEKRAYYEVWEWPEAQEWRATLGLGPKDLHVTLGLRGGDPRGVPKGRETLLK